MKYSTKMHEYYKDMSVFLKDRTVVVIEETDLLTFDEVQVRILRKDGFFVVYPVCQVLEIRGYVK